MANQKFKTQQPQLSHGIILMIPPKIWRKVTKPGPEIIKRAQSITLHNINQAKMTVSFPRWPKKVRGQGLTREKP